VRSEDILLGLSTLKVAAVADAAKAAVLMSLLDYLVIFLVEYLRLRRALYEKGVVGISANNKGAENGWGTEYGIFIVTPYHLAGWLWGWKSASKFQKDDSTHLLVGISSKPISMRMRRNSARTLRSGW
jgi:hypothetical protein